MPRATRSSLGGGDAAASTGSRSSSRTPAAKSPKASPAATASPRAARGKGKAEEKTEDTKRQGGRSTSRGKAATPSAAASRSRSSSAAAKTPKTPPAAVKTPKTPPSSAKRGRGKASQEDEEVKPKRARSRGQSAGKSPQRKGRSPAKAAPPAKNKGKSPAKAAARSTSRAGKSPAAKKSPAAPARGKGKSPAKATPARRQSKTPMKAVASKSPRTPAAKKSTPRSQTKATPPSRGSKSPRTPAKAVQTKKADVKKTTPRSKAATASASAPKSRSRRSKEPAETEQDEEEKEVPEPGEADQEPEKDDDGEEMAKSDENMKQDKGDTKDDSMEEDDTKDDSMEAAKGDTKEDSVNEKPVDKKDGEEEKSECEDVAKEEESEDKDLPKAEDTVVAVDAAEENEKMEQSSSDEKAEEPMENIKNGKEDSTKSSPFKSTATKRKFEEVSEETEDGPDSKVARVNGAGKEEDMEVKSDEPSAAAGETSAEGLLKDYVVVNKDEIPAADSEEVAASVPAEEADTSAQSVEMEEEAPAGEASAQGLLKDYVVVNKDEIPAADSEEVAASVPAEQADTSPQSVEQDKEADESSFAVPSSSGSVFVVPLTQVEMIKACNKASAVQSDAEDASSIAVEVGSLASSEISSRQLEILESMSAATSIDGDRAPSEGNLNDSMDDTDQSASNPPTATTDTAEAKSDDGAASKRGADPVIISDADSNNSSGPVNELAMPALDAAAAAACSENNGDVNQSASQPVGSQSAKGTAVNPAPVTQKDGFAAGSMNADGAGVSSAAESVSQSSSVFSRVYVPNPAVPTGSVGTEKSFSLVSYNILAECNRKKADYSYTAEEHLGQAYRHSVLMKELQYLDGDLVCLQEVNPHYFTSCLLPAMNSLGYEGLIMRRTQDNYDEGEATFYKKSVFEVESNKGVSLAELALKEVENGGVSEEVRASLRKYLDRADVVLISRLRHRASGKVVTVGNVHVVWDFSRCPDVQCVQIACAIKEVVSVSGSGGAHIVCGDFNSECTSPAYQMVVDGSLSDSSFTTLQAVNNLDLQDGPKSLVSHLKPAFQHTSAPLKSAYFTVKKSEPEISSLTSFMEGSVDYQFYTADSLVPLGVLSTVDKATVKATGGLPNKDFPSDHISLKSIMAFR